MARLEITLVVAELWAPMYLLLVTKALYTPIPMICSQIKPKVMLFRRVECSNLLLKTVVVVVLIIVRCEETCQTRWVTTAKVPNLKGRISTNNFHIINSQGLCLCWSMPMAKVVIEMDKETLKILLQLRMQIQWRANSNNSFLGSSNSFLSKVL